MTELEQKNIKTQLQLSKEINDADAMIIHCIRSASSSLLHSIEEKCFFKEGQKTVELTETEFNNIRTFLARLSVNASNFEFGKIHSNMITAHVAEKEAKTRILRMLS
jgi:hypothetical protein